MKATNHTRSFTRSAKMLALLALIFSLTSTAFAQSSASAATTTLSAEAMQQLETTLRDTATRNALSAAQWDAYSTSIEDALASESFGLQEGAMRMIIQYGRYFNLGHEAAISLVKLYREHENYHVRRMAVVAIGQTGNSWALGFLKRSVEFEQNESVQFTIRAVLAAQKRVDFGPSRQGH